MKKKKEKELKKGKRKSELFLAEAGVVFAVNGDSGAYRSPGINLGHIRGFHIDAAMAHGPAKVVVPIGTVEAVADPFGHFLVEEKQNIGNVGEIIISTQLFGAAGHFLGADLGPDSKSTGGGAVVGAGGNKEIKNFLAVFKTIQPLGGQVDLDPFAADGGVGFT